MIKTKGCPRKNESYADHAGNTHIGLSGFDRKEEEKN